MSFISRPIWFELFNDADRFSSTRLAVVNLNSSPDVALLMFHW